MSPTSTANDRFPRQGRGAAITGAHYTMLLGVLWFESGMAKAATLVLVGIISLFAWIGAWRRWRIASDTPTSKIRSAPQGYVELVGTAEPEAERILRDPVTHDPCLWFRVETWQRSGAKQKTWVLLKSAESSRSFVLRDETGTCQVAPAGAEFTGTTVHVQDGEDLEHRVSRIRAGDRLYVAGHFQTVHEVNVVRAASDGRPYLVSNHPRAHAGTHYRFWASLHLTFAIIGLLAAGWIISA